MRQSRRSILASHGKTCGYFINEFIEKTQQLFEQARPSLQARRSNLEESALGSRSSGGALSNALRRMND
jgi:hypothetical protein